jgi:hypothetical protein
LVSVLSLRGWNSILTEYCLRVGTSPGYCNTLLAQQLLSRAMCDVTSGSFVIKSVYNGGRRDPLLVFCIYLIILVPCFSCHEGHEQ